MPEDPKIAERDLETAQKTILPPAVIPKEGPPERPLEVPPESAPEVPTAESVPPLVDDSSLLAKIGPATPPQRAASLRMSEEARKLLDSGDYARALSRLERAIAVDSTNAYGYFLLAKAQHGLTRYKESLNFLDVAESRLGAEPFWLAEVHALRGENFRALGMMERAEASYQKALGINSGNRTAAEALARMHAENHPVQR